MLGLPGKYLVIIIECVFFFEPWRLLWFCKSGTGLEFWSVFLSKTYFCHFFSSLSAFRSRREGMLAGDRAPAPSLDSKTSSRVAEGVLYLRFRCLGKKLFLETLKTLNFYWTLAFPAFDFAGFISIFSVCQVTMAGVPKVLLKSQRLHLSQAQRRLRRLSQMSQSLVPWKTEWTDMVVMKGYQRIDLID